MSATDIILVIGAVLVVLAFAALVVVLLRVLSALRELRSEIETLRFTTRPIIDDMVIATESARDVIETARDDLARFDSVLGSAEAISDAVAGTSRVTRTVFSTPVIKVASMTAGVRETTRSLRRRKPSDDVVVTKKDRTKKRRSR
jgi:hypothetical protein